MAEGDDVGSHALTNFVNGTAAEAAALVAAMVGFFFEEAEAGAILEILPFDAASSKIFAEGLDGGEELSLLDGERGDGKLDGGPLLEEQEGFEQSHRVLPAGEADGYAVAFANHVELFDGLAHFAEERFFEFQAFSL